MSTISFCNKLHFYISSASSGAPSFLSLRNFILILRISCFSGEGCNPLSYVTLSTITLGAFFLIFNLELVELTDELSSDYSGYDFI